MNCNDISLLLDDHDTGALETRLRNDVDVHIATCRDCARDWALHARLVDRKLPALPPALVEECSALAMAHSARGRGARNGRLGALAAGVAALAAAAATLAIYQPDARDSAATAATAGASAGQQDSAVAAGMPASRESQEQRLAQATSPTLGADAAPAPSTSGRVVTVRVANADDLVLDESDRRDFDAFRAGLIDKLRQTPGVVVTEASPPTTPSFDYEVTLSATRQGDHLDAMMRVHRVEPGGLIQPVKASLGPECAPTCYRNAAILGESLGSYAARMMTPPAATQRKDLLVELQDFSLPPAQRLAALRDLDLRRPMGRNGPRSTDASGDSLRDPAIIAAVVDLAAAATSAAQRTEIFSMMRSITNPALVEPLVRAAELDPDGRVRATAVATLAADYAGDPRARQSLERIARVDALPLVRALAQSGLSGEATWNAYVRASLKDTALPDAERLEAALFQARSTSAAPPHLASLLDDGAITALTQVLPRAADAGMDASDVHALLNELAPVAHPAVTRMLLDSARHDSAFDRKQVMRLLADRTDEPEVAATLMRLERLERDESRARQAADKPVF